jgi:hypothetical protein
MIMVRSARVQAVVKGDDALLEHQVVGDVALEAEQTKAPVLIDTGDGVICFYESEQVEGQPEVAPVNANAIPVGPLPTSRIQVALSQAQTALLRSGLSQTVRVELTRASGKKETHYLFEELDVIERGFPQAVPTVILP